VASKAEDKDCRIRGPSRGTGHRLNNGGNTSRQQALQNATASAKIAIPVQTSEPVRRASGHPCSASQRYSSARYFEEGDPKSERGLGKHWGLRQPVVERPICQRHHLPVGEGRKKSPQKREGRRFDTVRGLRPASQGRQRPSTKAFHVKASGARGSKLLVDACRAVGNILANSGQDAKSFCPTPSETLTRASHSRRLQRPCGFNRLATKSFPKRWRQDA